MTSHTWRDKFRWAARGIRVALANERNFKVHLPMVALVAVAAAALGTSLTEWCVLALCVTVVLVAEMFNTALELLARAMTPDPNAAIRDALDVSAGGVLLAAIGASATGAIVFVHRIGAMSEWW